MKKYMFFVRLGLCFALVMTGASQNSFAQNMGLQMGLNNNSLDISDTSNDQFRQKLSGSGFNLAWLYRFPMGNSFSLTLGVEYNKMSLRNGDTTIDAFGVYAPVMLSWHVNPLDKLQLVPSVGCKLGGGDISKTSITEVRPVAEMALEWNRWQLGVQYGRGFVDYTESSTRKAANKTVAIFLRWYFL